MFRPLALTLTLAALPLASFASNLSFTSAGDFATAAGSTVVESFETTAPRVRTTGSPLATGLFTLSSPLAGLGVQNGPNDPQDGFGSSATDGTRYVSAYRPNQALGTLTFDLAAPALAFGFDLVDIEVLGSVISIRTDTGFFAGGVTLETVSTNAGNSSLRFFGITQDQAFSQVFLTLTGVDEAIGLDNFRIAPAPSAVPLPTTVLMLGAGLAALGARRRRV